MQDLHERHMDIKPAESFMSVRFVQLELKEGSSICGECLYADISLTKRN
jgi:hypothetical protein